MSIRWSEEQYQAHLQRAPVSQMAPVMVPRAAAAQRQNAHGMNKLEAEYAGLLEVQLRAGEIQWYGYERIKLRLAGRTFYTADFPVVALDGRLELHETKGHWRDDARVKIKVAAELYPFFRFVALSKRRKRDGGGWHRENFG